MENKKPQGQTTIVILTLADISLLLINLFD